MIKAKDIQNVFVLGVSSVLSEGVNKIFGEKNHIGNQKLGKVKKLQVRSYGDFLVKGNLVLIGSFGNSICNCKNNKLFALYDKKISQLSSCLLVLIFLFRK